MLCRVCLGGFHGLLVIPLLGLITLDLAALGLRLHATLPPDAVGAPSRSKGAGSACMRNPLLLRVAPTRPLASGSFLIATAIPRERSSKCSFVPCVWDIISSKLGTKSSALERRNSILLHLLKVGFFIGIRSGLWGSASAVPAEKLASRPCS
jgi:hypothetical protein